MCCDCCMLGLEAVSRGSSCELQGLLLGRQCAHAARTCCGKNTNEETQADDKGKKTQTVVGLRPLCALISSTLLYQIRMATGCLTHLIQSEHTYSHSDNAHKS